MRRARTFLLAIGAAVLVVAGGGAALAQYPPAGATDCADTFDEGGGRTTDFAPGDSIQVRGIPDCADPNEPDIEALLFSDPVLLDRFDANPDGSYSSAVVNIPADTEPGSHDVVVRTADAEHLQAITVTEGAVPAGLPATGRDIAVLALWGTLTLVLGSALVGLTWRRWREAKAEADLGQTWTNRPYTVGTLTETEAVPYRPQMTEWVDPPSRRGTASADDTASGDDSASEEDGTPEPETVPHPDAAQDADGGLGEEARDVALRTSERTTEIVDRLRADITSWRK